jgi:hypothetical protein
LNRGRETGSTANPYYTQAEAAGNAERAWGPSSEHNGGVVMHVYADNHTEGISEDIEAEVYYALITKGGNEAVEIE